MRFANGHSAHGICTPPMPFTSMTLVIAINLAMDGECLYGTAEELIQVSADPDFIPEPRSRKHYAKLNYKRRDYSGGTSRSSLFPRGNPASSNDPSLKAKSAAQSMTTLEVLKKRRLLISAMSAPENDSADGGGGVTVDDTAGEESPGE